MLTLVEQRKQIKIFVSAKAKKVVEDFAEQFDMKEMGVASRIYSWFGSLPLPVQKWITGLTDGDEGKGMKLFAKSLLEGDAKIRSIFENQTPPTHDEKQDEPPEQTASGRGGKKSK